MPPINIDFQHLGKALVFSHYLFLLPIFFITWLVGYLDYSILFALPVIPAAFFGLLFIDDFAIEHSSIHRKYSLSFKRNPNHESAEWLNYLMKIVFNYYGEFAAKEIIKQIEPILEQKKPAFIKELKFTQVHLGKYAPKLSNLKVYNTDQKEMIFDVRCSMDADLSVTLRANAGVNSFVQISNLFFDAHARVHVFFIPNHPPFVKVARIQLLEAPEVDLETRLGAFNRLAPDVLKTPGVLAIKKLLIDAVNQVLVHPNYLELDFLEILGMPPPPEESEEDQKKRAVFSPLGAIGDVGDAMLDGVKGVGRGIMAVGELGVDGVGAVGKGVFKAGELGVEGVSVVGKGIGKGAVAVGEGVADGVGAVGKGLGKGVMAVGGGVSDGVGAMGKAFGFKSKKDKKEKDVAKDKSLPDQPLETETEAHTTPTNSTPTPVTPPNAPTTTSGTNTSSNDSPSSLRDSAGTPPVSPNDRSSTSLPSTPNTPAIVEPHSTTTRTDSSSDLKSSTGSSKSPRDSKSPRADSSSDLRSSLGLGSKTGSSKDLKAEIKKEKEEKKKEKKEKEKDKGKEGKDSEKKKKKFGLF